jgi:hypothetical protein
MSHKAIKICQKCVSLTNLSCILEFVVLSYASSVFYLPHRKKTWKVFSLVSRCKVIAKLFFYYFSSCDSSAGVALGCGLDDRGSGVRFPAESGNFSLHHRVQDGSGAHQASYPTGTRGSFLGVQRSGREAEQLPPLSAEVRNAWSYTSIPSIRI